MVIKAGNYTVMGAGFNTVFAWAGSAAPNLGAVVVVQGVGFQNVKTDLLNVLSIKNKTIKDYF